jgi:23S rRNA (uracil747-C5)-methyltransferase
MDNLQQLLQGIAVNQWCPPVSGAEQSFRNKAKMVVSGSVEKPLLGMLHRDGTPEDLTDCPLYPPSFAPIFSVLKPFIARAGLTPYNVARKRGELKYILITESQRDGGIMLRFVLRSEAKIDALRRLLPELQAQLPQLKVISANIQPVHMAIMEGPQEIPLTDEQALAEEFNNVPLFIRPQSCFQTNPQVASALYAAARDWVRMLPVRHMWDLFCGVGGFGLHCATPEMKLTGIEIAPQAIACAQRSAAMLGLNNIQFQALDSTAFALAQQDIPDLVLVNPPRRGIGPALCDYLSAMRPAFIVYSSCNAETMARDMTLLPDYQLERVQLFDMFPHTAHYEVLTLLIRRKQA